MQLQKTSGLVDLLKENMVLRAEVEALMEILRVAEMTEQVPMDWRALLKETRQTKRYRDAAQQYDSVFRQVENSASKMEIDELLQIIPLMELMR